LAKSKPTQMHGAELKCLKTAIRARATTRQSPADPTFRTYFPLWPETLRYLKSKRFWPKLRWAFYEIAERPVQSGLNVQAQLERVFILVAMSIVVGSVLQVRCGHRHSVLLRGAGRRGHSGTLDRLWHPTRHVRPALKVPRSHPSPVTPREWFLVPLFAIDEAVERIRDGSIKGVAYDPETASLK
jgi:hypothetical protein